MPAGVARGARVLVVGSLNVDSTSYVDRFPRPGETLASHGFAVALGGKGTNQAVAAYLAGADVDLLARVGDDAAGAFALAELARVGVATAGVARLDGVPTGVAQITVADSGENTIVITAGANGRLDPGALDDAAERIADAAVVVTQGELAAATVDRVAALAADTGTRLVLNLAPPLRVAAATLATADPLVVNEHEARAAGIGVDLADDAGLDAWRAAASSAVPGIARSVVVTLGAAGAVAADAAGATAVRAPRVEAVDTTGAGDAAVGTLAALLAAGGSLADALRAAVAAGALAVQRPGTVDSYADRARVDDLAARLEEIP